MSPTLNPALTGFRCLRCDAQHGVVELFEGCPRCAEDGHAASVVASYEEGAVNPLPVLGAPSLAEGDTPLLPLDALAAELGLGSLHLKAEGRNPTGSHKDRMSPLVVARAAMLGFKRVIAASSGNAGVSLAAYAARAGLACTILTRKGILGTYVQDMRALGADVVVVDTSAERWAHMALVVRAGDAYPATNYLTPPVGSNPFGVQGYKGVGHELARDLDGVDVILVPTARGDLLWGIWAGLCEASDRLRPRMIAVEPFSRTAQVLAGADYRGSFPGDSVQAAIAGGTVTWQTVHTLRASRGLAIEVDDAGAFEAQRALGRLGVELEPCSAAPLTGLRRLVAEGGIKPGSRVVLIGTSDGRREHRGPR
ncbi:MAG: pyridoxal-phosphate dependent enzyme [Alphaproteobacteria bacterium]|nr:pyridoxal-phosphate dependent enzyme [Alphaproteobacteria bacterium]